MNKSTEKFSEEKFNNLKITEADLIRDLQAVVKNPDKEADLKDDIFKNHQKWLKLVMPNYIPEVHLELVNSYEQNERYQSYYDDKAGKGAAKILISVVKEHLTK